MVLRRIAVVLAAEVDVRRPIRQKRHRIVKAGELERAIELAAQQVPVDALILVLLDADDDSPARLGPPLLERATAARPDRRIAVVLACREFESWFLGGAEALAGQRGLDRELIAPEDPESVANAKRWLSDRMVDRAGLKYSETRDQAAFAARFDMVRARARCASFDKFLRDIERALRGG